METSDMEIQFYVDHLESVNFLSLSYVSQWFSISLQSPSGCLLRNLYAGQEAVVRTRHGITDRFKIGKGISPSCIFVTLLI